MEGGPQVGLVVVPVVDGGEAARDGRHDPRPVGGDDAPLLLLALQVGQEAAGLGVVVGDLHPGRLEGVQHRDVQLHQRPVAPQRALPGGVEAEQTGDDGEQVVAVGVHEVAGADLGAHVPAVERGQRVVDAADRQPHVGDGGQGVPAQSELGEPRIVRVLDGHFEHQLARHVEQPGLVAVRLDDQGQHVEPAAGGLPAHPADEVGERGLPLVADRGAVHGAVAGVPDQLGVPHPGRGPVGGGRGEHGDQRADAALVGGHPQVLHQVAVDLLRGHRGAPVDDAQAPPVQAAYAAAGVAPGHPRAELQLGVRVPVGPGLLQVFADLPQPRLEGHGLVRLFGVELPDELLRLAPVGHAPAGRRRPGGRMGRRMAGGCGGVRGVHGLPGVVDGTGTPSVRLVRLMRLVPDPRPRQGS